MEEEQLKKWVERLQYYIKNVENAQGEINQHIAVQALLGYLSSLEVIIKMRNGKIEINDLTNILQEVSNLSPNKENKNNEVA